MPLATLLAPLATLLAPLATLLVPLATLLVPLASSSCASPGEAGPCLRRLTTCPKLSTLSAFKSLPARLLGFFALAFFVCLARLFLPALSLFSGFSWRPSYELQPTVAL